MFFWNNVEIFNPEFKYLSSWSRDACTGLHEISAINHISACMESSVAKNDTFFRCPVNCLYRFDPVFTKCSHWGKSPDLIHFPGKSLNRKPSFLQQRQPLLTVSPTAGMLETCNFFSFFKLSRRTGKLSWEDFIQVRLEAYHRDDPMKGLSTLVF